MYKSKNHQKDTLFQSKRNDLSQLPAVAIMKELGVPNKKAKITHSLDKRQVSNKREPKLHSISFIP
jgi:uncharacterized protein YcgL (UPF0745 family)